MKADECFQALVRCHTPFDHRNNTSNIDRPAGNQDVGASIADNFSGPGVARQFAEEVTNILSQSEFNQLLEFLESPHSNGKYPKNETETKLSDRVGLFHSREPPVPGQNADDISFPGGPVDADLGIILHLKSGENMAVHFWDPKSASISLLEANWITGTLAFGYDWHWRSEQTYRDRSSCPLQKWSPKLKQLHNQVSADILEIL